MVTKKKRLYSTIGNMAGTLKLTDEDVKGIRYAKEREGMSMRAIGSLYGISPTQVFRIVNGKQRKRNTSRKTKFLPLDEKRAMDFLSRIGVKAPL